MRELPGCHAGTMVSWRPRPTSQHDDEMRSTDLIHHSNQDEAGWMMAGPLHWLPPSPLSSVAFKLIPGQSVERLGRAHQLNRALQRFMTLRRIYRNEATHRLSLPVCMHQVCLDTLLAAVPLLYLSYCRRSNRRAQLAVGWALFEAGQGWAGCP